MALSTRLLVALALVAAPLPAAAANSSYNSVAAIDTKSFKVVATIPVGQVPKRMNTLVLPGGALASAATR